MTLTVSGTNGLSLHVVEWGARTQDPVILLHGLRGYGHWFDELAEVLAHDHYVIAPDLRGRGASDHSAIGDYRIEVLVDDLEDVVAAVDAKSVTLVGHSLGGIIALGYVARFPEMVERLAIIDVAPLNDEAGMERTRGELKKTPREFANWDEARAFIKQRHGTVSAQRLETRVRWMLREAQGGTVGWRLDQEIFDGPIPDETPERMWRWIHRVQCPTLVAKGSRSDIVPTRTAEEMLAALPSGSSFTEIPDAGHMVMDDNPQGTIDAVVNFLADSA